MDDFYFGVDIGGTFIKGGVVDSFGNILLSKKIETNLKDFELSTLVVSLLEQLSSELNLDISKAKGLGIACAGLIDEHNDVIEYSPNLWLKNYPLKKNLKKRLDIPIDLINDAEASLIAEQQLGAGKNIDSFLMLTIGTGVGGGFVFNNLRYRKFNSFACEIGHMKISGKSLKCNCGEYNCFETLASTSALIRETKLAMKKHPESKMWKTYSLDTVSGKTVFEYKDIDETAKTVFDEFIKNLGNGIVSLVNILCPPVVIIGGGISKQKDNLLKPLSEYVNSHIHTKNIDNKIKFCTSSFDNDSGIIGAVCMLKERRNKI